MTIETLLTQARQRIQVEKAELDLARYRRTQLADALRSACPGGRVYVGGSIAHGDALTPLTDLDVGIVVVEAAFGPGLRGPRDLMERARDIIKEKLGPEYPKLTVTVEGQKRSVLVRFGDPITNGAKDFTADVIIALDTTNPKSLLIPRLTNNSWEPAAPEEHTRLILSRVERQVGTVGPVFAQVVRLVKHWNKKNGKPLCSWQIKALALWAINGPTTQHDGLLTWFAYAADDLAARDTPDPAGVCAPIKTKGSRLAAARLMEKARDSMRRAIQAEQAGRPNQAHVELRDLFGDIISEPDSDAAAREMKAAIDAGSYAGVGLAAVAAVAPKVRSWAAL